MKKIALFVCSFLFVSLNAQVLNLSGYFYDNYITGLSQPTVMAILSPNQFLVCEKATGKVKHFLNGVYQGDALDLTVANNSERGLLGICLDPDFSTNNRVFLYYSYALTDGGSWIDNRVERYVWNGSTLTFDMTLITFPFDATQSNGPNHDGGILRIGPDKKLYIATGDLNRGRFTNPRIEQNTSTTAVAQAGAIYRLNLDGTIPADNPFAGETNSYIRSMFAYGVRNCYGMMFDSLTGRFWMTDNGPNVYDEINTFEAGANVGWLKIMGPDSRNATYSENGNTAYNAADLIYLPGAFYVDPIFSYLSPIGIAAIGFMNSHKFSPPVQGSALIGEANNGGIYMFQLNANRDDFILEGALADRVADNTTERNTNRVGTTWGIITDIQIGPDGYLYLVSLSQGKVTRIRPENDLTLAKDFLVTVGQLIGGNVNQTHFSDDDYMKLRARVGRGGEVAAQVQFISTAPPTTSAKTLQELKYTTEIKTSRILVQEVHLYNYNNSDWELVSSSLTSTSDKVETVSITTNINRFINSANREIKAQITWKALASAIGFPPEISIDEATWRFIYN